MANSDHPFIDISNGGFSSGQLTLVLRNLGGSVALIHQLEAGGEQIGLSRFSLAPGDVVEKKVDLSSRKITRELLDPPQLRLLYKSLGGQELATVADVEQVSRADGGFNIGQIEGGRPQSASSDSGDVREPSPTKVAYDVALSYAGEDREFVAAVHNALVDRDVSVFFDKAVDEEIEMWGKNLLTHLQEVYGTGKARYCVAFISGAYKRKAFPTYELENAVAHAVTKNPGSVLPILLEGNELPPPLVSTTVYIPRGNQSAQQLADKIAAKVKGTKLPKTAPGLANVRMPRIPSTKPDPNGDPDNVLKYLVTELGKRGKALRDNGIDVAVVQRGQEQIVQVKHGNKNIYNVAIWLGGVTGDDELCFYQWTDRRMAGTNSMHAFGRVEWSQVKNAYVINLTNVSLLKEIGGQYALTPPELVDLLWENIVSAIEEEYERQ
jgi:hypothetical protein